MTHDLSVNGTEAFRLRHAMLIYRSWRSIKPTMAHYITVKVLIKLSYAELLNVCKHNKSQYR